MTYPADPTQPPNTASFPAQSFHVGAPPPMPQQPMMPQPPKKSSKALIVTIVVAVVALAVGCGIGTAIGSSGTTPAAASGPQPAVTVTATETVTAAAVIQPTQAAPATTKAAVPAKPAVPTSFGDGTFLVGKDIQPGVYSVTVPSDSNGCYWERDKDLNGGLNSILANDDLNPGAHGTINVRKSDYAVTSNDCGTWKKA